MTRQQCEAITHQSHAFITTEFSTQTAIQCRLLLQARSCKLCNYSAQSLLIIAVIAPIQHSTGLDYLPILPAAVETYFMPSVHSRRLSTTIVVHQFWVIQLQGFMQD